MSCLSLFELDIAENGNKSAWCKLGAQREMSFEFPAFDISKSQGHNLPFLKVWDILGVICEDIGVLMATCLNDKTAERSPVSLMGIRGWI